MRPASVDQRDLRPLVIVCDWIPPAYGAVGQYQLASALEAARSGRPTTLIGLGQGPRDSEEVMPAEVEGAASLRIVRLAARPAQKTNLLRRGLWSMHVNLRLVGRTLKALQPRDGAEIKVTGSPPFLAYIALLLNATFLRRSVTYRITDFYPETAIAAGRAGFLKISLPFFHWLRRRADRLEVLSECQERRLLEGGLPKSRITIVRDGSPVDMSAPSAVPARPFPADKAILLYSGNLGVAHDVQTFAEAYRQHVRNGPDTVRLWLNATGAKVRELTEFCERNALPLHVTPPAPLDQLPGILSSATAHLVTLDKPFWGYVIPSKIYACIASGRPVLYIGPEESDIHRLIAPVAGAASIRNGDVAACLAALDRLGVEGAGEQTAPPPLTALSPGSSPQTRRGSGSV